MVGAIRKRDILGHPFVTIHFFGWRIFFRALFAGRSQTFLSLLADANALRPSAVKAPELVDQCIELELRAKRVYEWLAGQFVGHEPVCDFFETLARQEQGHSELLQLCRRLAGREQWLEENFSPWRDALPRLARQLEEIESLAKDHNGVDDALRLVIRIEASEINGVFRGVVTATDSKFVKKLHAFKTAGTRHISYICQTLPRLEPELTQECQDLKDRNTLAKW